MSKPNFAVVRRDYQMHAWAGVYTSNYRATVERTTMTYAFAKALCAKLWKDAGEPEEEVSWVVEPLTGEGRLARHAWEEQRWALSNAEIPF
jgi:hypothetical protein